MPATILWGFLLRKKLEIVAQAQQIPLWTDLCAKMQCVQRRSMQVSLKTSGNLGANLGIQSP